MKRQSRNSPSHSLALAHLWGLAFAWKFHPNPAENQNILYFLPLLFVSALFEFLLWLQPSVELAVLGEVQVSGLVTITHSECSSDIQLRYSGIVGLNDLVQTTGCLKKCGFVFVAPCRDLNTKQPQIKKRWSFHVISRLWKRTVSLVKL